MKDDVKLTPELLHGIAREMGTGWRAELPDPDHDRHWTALHGPDGAEIGVGQTWPRGRIELHGSYPRPPDGISYSPPRESCKITVSADAAPARIANEIRRRLLPGYLEALAGYKRRLGEAIRYRDEQERIKEHVKVLTGGHTGHSRQGGEVYFDEGKAECYPDRVKLELRVSPDLAIAILRGVVATRRPEVAPVEDEAA